MSERPSYLNRAAAISAAAAVATVALTVGIAAEIANNLHPAAAVVGGTRSGFGLQHHVGHRLRFGQLE